MALGRIGTKWTGLDRIGVGLKWSGGGWIGVEFWIGLKLNSTVLELDWTRLDFDCIGLASMMTRLGWIGVELDWSSFPLDWFEKRFQWN